MEEINIVVVLVTTKKRIRCKERWLARVFTLFLLRRNDTVFYTLLGSSIYISFIPLPSQLAQLLLHFQTHFSTRLLSFLFNYHYHNLPYFFQKVFYSRLFIPFTLLRFSGTRPTDKHAICRVIVSTVDNSLGVGSHTGSIPIK